MHTFARKDIKHYRSKRTIRKLLADVEIIIRKRLNIKLINISVLNKFGNIIKRGSHSGGSAHKRLKSSRNTRIIVGKDRQGRKIFISSVSTPIQYKNGSIPYGSKSYIPAGTRFTFSDIYK